MKEKKSSIEKHSVACPHCGKTVLDHMTQCPFCNGKLKSAYYDTSNIDSAEKRKWKLIILVATLVVVAAIVVIRAVI